MTKSSGAVAAVAGLAAGIIASALLGASAARADYIVTPAPTGSNTVLASTPGGTLNTAGLVVSGVATNRPTIAPALGQLIIGTQLATGGSVLSFQIPAALQATNPTSFGTGPFVQAPAGQNIPPFANGQVVGIQQSLNRLLAPAPQSANLILGPSNASFNGDFTSLGITPGTYTWTWGTGPNQSFTIDAVPGPIVGAGLPGLIAALGGLVAMARRRRKQLA